MLEAPAPPPSAVYYAPAALASPIWKQDGGTASRDRIAARWDGYGCIERPCILRWDGHSLAIDARLLRADGVAINVVRSWVMASDSTSAMTSYALHIAVGRLPLDGPPSTS